MLLPQSEISQKKKIGELMPNTNLINKKKTEISMRMLELEKIENKLKLMKDIIIQEVQRNILDQIIIKN